MYIYFSQKPYYFFAQCPYNHVGNTFLVGVTPYKCCWNLPFNLIYVKSFISVKEKVNYLIGIVLSYLKLLHYSRFCVPTYVQDNPFGAIKHVPKDDTNYNTLFEKCFGNCNANFCRNSPTSEVSSRK
jgi:hypothetical protein